GAILAPEPVGLAPGLAVKTGVQDRAFGRWVQGAVGPEEMEDEVLVLAEDFVGLAAEHGQRRRVDESTDAAAVHAEDAFAHGVEDGLLAVLAFDQSLLGADQCPEVDVETE